MICGTLTSTKKLKVSSLQSAGQRSFARFLFFFLSFFFFFLVSIFSERDQNKILLSRDISLTFSLHVKVLLTRKVLSVFLNMNRTPITVTVSLDSVELTVLTSTQITDTLRSLRWLDVKQRRKLHGHKCLNLLSLSHLSNQFCSPPSTTHNRKTKQSLHISPYKVSASQCTFIHYRGVKI